MDPILYIFNMLLYATFIAQQSRGFATRTAFRAGRKRAGKLVRQSKSKGGGSSPKPRFSVRFLQGSEEFKGQEVCSIEDGIKLNVTYTNEAGVVGTWLDDALREGAKAFGFDTETKPRFSKRSPGESEPGPALLQLATADGKCLVVQLAGRSWRNKKQKALVKALQPVLGNKKLPKVGVGLDDDCVELWRGSKGSLEVKCRIDIGGVGVSAVRSDNPETVTGDEKTTEAPALTNFDSRSLTSVTQAILGVSLAKPRRVQVSNWGGKPPLLRRQVTYAAADAWAGAAVFSELARRRPDLFGSVSLASGSLSLSSDTERSVQELSERRERRRQIREELKQVKRRYAAVYQALWGGNEGEGEERDQDSRSSWAVVPVPTTEEEKEKLRLALTEMDEKKASLRETLSTIRPDPMLQLEPTEIGL